MIQKMVWAGSNLSSYAQAEDALRELCGQSISDRRIRRQTEDVGRARVAEREAGVRNLKSMTFSDRRLGSSIAQAPELAVIMMDGGRYQRRDHFGQSKDAGAVSPKHWRESKVGCLLTMQSRPKAEDPCFLIPKSFVHASVVRELAKMAEKQGSNELEPVPSGSSVNHAVPLDDIDYEPPQLISRDVVASSQTAEEFGWQLESRAFQLNFPSAQRIAFVADGAKTNWRIQEQHFPRATPIADLIHALSYVWSATQASGGATTYDQWAQWIWQGEASKVIAELERLQFRIGLPPQDAPTHDPRCRVDRTLTYLRNNSHHMNYPEYRRQGMPITSTHIESTIKQINRRIKGSEKFWLKTSSECILQLRADYLSESNPMPPFWNRWLANQTGSNHYLQNAS